MTKAINIISFDVPFPANYGGVIDVYYKLVWLKNAGVKVHLHCFTYGREASKELEALCEKVYYYPRKTGTVSFFSFLPYNVKSRQSVELEKNLLSNDFPILFEVLHTCYLLNDARFKDRKKIYRHSNIEHDYYLQLSKSERNASKRFYLRTEANKLKRFEKIVNYADIILAVNENDAAYFNLNYPKVKTVYLPSFHPNQEVNIKSGNGDYILYNGNLSISENYESAQWLIENVFSRILQKVIIAGLNPPAFLKKSIEGYAHIQLIENPSAEKMEELIENAQIHCLHTFQATGLKLKLLNVLFTGRFVICNPKMIVGTHIIGGDKSGIFISNVPERYIELINNLIDTEVSMDVIEERKKSLEIYFNQVNIKKLLEVI
ncbi:MAG: glycosyltransferase family 1 protein [Bacteroidota bacterium]|nr:glycosyltransferase family 1 protein [Bacteroidota bacterium]